ncbi:hypothetical protein BT69DRAFT_444514 [Atractiella rhizophila]|nr:hypothetical protein BT69DRAFT_444514 [Atractiella rhizophila]
MPRSACHFCNPAQENTELSWTRDDAIPSAIVNVQHACRLAGCTNDGTDFVRQER